MCRLLLTPTPGFSRTVTLNDGKYDEDGNVVVAPTTIVTHLDDSILRKGNFGKGKCAVKNMDMISDSASVTELLKLFNVTAIVMMFHAVWCFDSVSNPTANRS